MDKKFEQIVYFCRMKSVSFSLTYEECANTWYFGVHSIAPAEAATSKSSTYEHTVEKLIYYLEKL